MVSATVNVVRYTALLTGVFYGIIHKRSLQASHNQKREELALHHKEDLIERAKEAWKQKKANGSGDGVVMDPEDPNFDLEKLFSKWEKET